MSNNFYSIYQHGFIRTAVCIPKVQIADPKQNAEHILELARQASDQQATVALFPELSVSAYTNDDLFHQDALLESTVSGIANLVEQSRSLSPILLVGAPLRFEDRLFNCSVVIYKGQVLGIAPKTFLPSYREFYEKRQFNPASTAISDEVRFLGQDIPFGNNIIFQAANMPNFRLHTEIGEDLWTPVPPSVYAAMAGATVLTNLSASSMTVGKSEYRRRLCEVQSTKCMATYLYAGSGPGESTTDLAWDGHGLIYENGNLMAESERFVSEGQMIIADVDLEHLVQERTRMTSFSDSVAYYKEQLQSIRHIPFEYEIPEVKSQAMPVLIRTIERFPYVPCSTTNGDESCGEIFNIQVQGLVKRLSFTGIKRLVVGISGGLDSTQSVLVGARAMDILGLPRENLLTYTMPGFATTDHTYDNAHGLMKALGATSNDVTFENVQAGERASHLFRLANYHEAMVMGTSDLSELAQGWGTYGVGDTMSHYNTNASISKTLIQHQMRWLIRTNLFGEDASEVIQSILDTQITPELIPPGKDGSGKPIQSSEAKTGPYELQDFHIYYTSRFGFRPSKVAFLSYHAWGDKERGIWPETILPDQRNEYDLLTIKRWLDSYLYRFFSFSQFKRSAMPNGPKVWSGGTLSPRTDWRAPSDAVADAWLRELRENVPDEQAVVNPVLNGQAENVVAQNGKSLNGAAQHTSNGSKNESTEKIVDHSSITQLDSKVPA